MSASTTFRAADRKHTSVLAAAEKRTLVRMAESLPQWVNSDHLTGLGFVSLIAAAACYALARYHEYWLLAVLPFLALNWFGDSLDGTLARVRNKQRPRYGFYVDHILDAIGFFILMGGIALSGYISTLVAAAFIIAYLLLSIEIYLATYAVGKFHLSYWSFGPTELRLLLSAGNIALLWHPNSKILGQEYKLFDFGFGTGTVALALILIQATVKHTVQLYKEETK